MVSRRPEEAGEEKLLTYFLVLTFHSHRQVTILLPLIFPDASPCATLTPENSVPSCHIVLYKLSELPINLSTDLVS